MMRFIGVTGGVGAGKSTVMEYLRQHTNSEVVLADDVARELMQPGTEVNAALRERFGDVCTEEGDALFEEDGGIRTQAFARYLLSDEQRRTALNAIVHPAVKSEVLQRVEAHRKSGDIDFFFLEAALLIEDGYKALCDELWYVYVTEENRRKRLREMRGYGEERLDALFAAQLPEHVFLEHCCVVIDNNGTKEETIEQVRRAVSLRLPRRVS